MRGENAQVKKHQDYTDQMARHEEDDPNEASERLIMSSTRKIAQLENMLNQPLPYEIPQQHAQMMDVAKRSECSQKDEPRDFQ